jgi:hydrogenase maturation protease
MKILVVGLGNPILGDDGVGWRVVEHVQEKLRAQTSVHMTTIADDKIEFDCLAVGGLSLMERLIGSDYVILVDSIFTKQPPIGTVMSFPLSELPNRALGHLCSSHDTTLQNAIQVGRSMGAQLPDDIVVVGVETQEVFDFSEHLSEPVAAAVPEAAQIVLTLIERKYLDPMKFHAGIKNPEI